MEAPLFDNTEIINALNDAIVTALMNNRIKLFNILPRVNRSGHESLVNGFDIFLETCDDVETKFDYLEVDTDGWRVLDVGLIDLKSSLGESLIKNQSLFMLDVDVKSAKISPDNNAIEVEIDGKKMQFFTENGVKNYTEKSGKKLLNSNKLIKQNQESAISYLKKSGLDIEKCPNFYISKTKNGNYLLSKGIHPTLSLIGEYANFHVSDSRELHVLNFVKFPDENKISMHNNYPTEKQNSEIQSFQMALTEEYYLRENITKIQN